MSLLKDFKVFVDMHEAERKKKAIESEEVYTPYNRKGRRMVAVELRRRVKKEVGVTK